MDRHCFTLAVALLLGPGGCSRKEPASASLPGPKDILMSGSSVPPVSRLLSDYQSVGLFQDVKEAGFLELVGKHFDRGEFEEMLEESKDKPEAFLYTRHFILGKLRGVIPQLLT